MFKRLLRRIGFQGQWIDDEPNEGDYIISSSGSLGEKIIVGQYGYSGILGEFKDYDNAEKFIKRRARQEQYFPSVWILSDHGNYHLIENWNYGFAGQIKYFVRVSHYGTIDDIQHRHDLSLVTDSQDVDVIKDYLGHNKEIEDFDGFYVKVGEGEYTEIYGFYGNTPYLFEDLYKINFGLRPTKSRKKKR